MSLSDLASLGSFVSGIAVLASLVYLSLQIRQNSRHTLAVIEQNRIARAVSHYMAMAEPHMAAAHIVENGGSGTAEEIRQRQFHLECWSQNLAWQDTFFQREQGLISVDTFAGTRAYILTRLREEPGLRRFTAHWLRTAPTNAFARFVSEILAEAEAAAAQQ